MNLQVRYARNDDVSIAYLEIGEGPLDLLILPGFVSHLEVSMEHPPIARFFRRLASFARVILFDKRGTGLSDRGIDHSMDLYAADARAVMDAVGSQRAAVLGISEGGATALLFAGTYPERTSALIVYGGFARVAEAHDFPIGLPADLLLRTAEYMSSKWGTGVGLAGWAPSLAHDEDQRQWWARFQRLSASPRDVKMIMSAYSSIDVRHALPAISAPTLVVHRKDDVMVPVDLARFVADNVAGAKYLELEGADHFVFTGNSDAILDEIEEFLTGVRRGPEPNRKLATVLFTDIVGSTDRASSVGDSDWSDLLGRHDSMVRRALVRFTGHEVKTTGDGFLATFEGPTAAIRCADSVRDGATGLGIEVRIGIHTGEIEVTESDVGGIGVNIARRVCDLAGPSEVWVSATVPGVVVGSGIEFQERGAHSLKGLPGETPLFSVERR